MMCYYLNVQFHDQRVNTTSDTVTLWKWLSGAPDSHLQRVTIPDAVLIKFDLLMMSTTLLETFRGL